MHVIMLEEKLASIIKVRVLALYCVMFFTIECEDAHRATTDVREEKRCHCNPIILQ